LLADDRSCDCRRDRIGRLHPRQPDGRVAWQRRRLHWRRGARLCARRPGDADLAALPGARIRRRGRRLCARRGGRALYEALPDRCDHRPEDVLDLRALRRRESRSRREAARPLAVLGEVLTAIVTPFNSDGSVNFDKFRELAGYLVDHGSDGIVVAGTTGESPTLSDDEKLELFAAAVDAVGARATVVAGTGTYDTRHSAHMTELADPLGVDGFLVVTPYYNKPPQRAIIRHFEE